MARTDWLDKYHSARNDMVRLDRDLTELIRALKLIGMNNLERNLMDIRRRLSVASEGLGEAFDIVYAELMGMITNHEDRSEREERHDIIRGRK